ncbi:hypothetical protein [Mycobacterium bourgelatii]|uniref:Uncharacterized protein n=1 Tax=Mycobacterium bourgelatii TaxID=1273442 RepID=A0A7I9YS75_MYCBU|nr:hypothetical protein [Mycobacterium bourgelatii]MCV6974180.1 hypothetical protein [Mycobacterium bourgelatii]GFG91363.1 hypothetical protein MBOU_34050 [Mycobacterium bourgelatii]
MAIDGKWDVKIKTPIGSLATQYAFTAGPGGLAGTATYKDETVALQDLTADGERVTWRQSVSKPMRLNLKFDVVVDGDTMTGHSRAGRLPRSEVTGRRRS